MASKKNWIQGATKGMRKDKPCTGSKFGSSSCPAGSKRYNLAKTFKSMSKEEKVVMPLKKEIRVCEHCKQDFLGTKTRKYCGYECAKASRKVIIYKNCVECNKEIIVQNWNKDTQFCSMKCKAQHQSAEILDLVCTNCSKEFCRKDFKVYRNKSGNSFCSKACADSFNRGSNHYEWKEHLHDKHLTLALKQWSNIIKKRDNYTCQLCGENSDNKLLQAHHIKHRSTNPELQLNFDNGITLCMKCHALQHIDNDKAHRLIMYSLNSLNLN